MKILFLKMSTSFFTQMSQKATVVYHRNSISIHSVLVKKQRFWFCSSDKTITFCIIPLDYMFDSRMLDKSNLCLTPQTQTQTQTLTLTLTLTRCGFLPWLSLDTQSTQWLALNPLVSGCFLHRGTPRGFHQSPDPTASLETAWNTLSI